MNYILAFVIGALYTAGLYMMMRRSIVKLILGLVLIGHAANLLIFTVTGLQRAVPPVIPEGAAGLATQTADPVPQALILTSIVIGFGVLAFSLVLIHRAHELVSTDDLDEMRATDT
jgi:multicomponent Na+:H+ antiporter subunit C